MRGSRRLAAPWGRVVLFLFLIAVSMPPHDAAASTTDWAASSNGGSINSTDFTNAANTIDSNSATAGTFVTASTCNSYGDGYAPYNRVALGGGSSQFQVRQIHVKLTVPCFGSLSAIEISCGSGGYSWSKSFPITALATDADFDLTTGGSGYSGKCTMEASRVLGMRYWFGGGGGTAYLYDFQAYDAAQVGTVGIENYCYNMNVQHPWFAWDVFCNIRQDYVWHGTIVVTYDGSSPKFKLESCSTFGLTGCDSTEYTTSLSLNPVSGFGAPGTPNLVWLRQGCSLGACASTQVTITITDTDHNKTASYTFLRSANGMVQDLTVRPALIMFRGCYNSTLNQCNTADPLFATGAAGTASFRWEVTPGTSYAMALGKFTRMDANGSPRLTSTGSYAAVDLAAGTEYTVSVAAASSGVWGIIARNPAGESWKSADIDVTNTTAAATGTEYPPNAGTQYGAGPCDVQHLDNCFKNLFSTSSGSILSVVTGPFNDLLELAKTKQPFAFIARASDGIGAQLTRALSSSTSTSTCPGVPIKVPLSDALPSFSFPSWLSTYVALDGLGNPTVYMLKCSDLEPILGGTVWQGINTFLNAAIPLAAAWHELKRLQPKPVLAG